MDDPIQVPPVSQDGAPSDPSPPLQPIADNVFENAVPAPSEPETTLVPQPDESATPQQPELASNIPAVTLAATQQLFDQIVEKIIEQQEAIIGPVAVEQAKQIKELKINWPQHDVDIEGSPQSAIDQLVEQYKELFGQIAVQVSKEAVASILAQLPAEQQPKSLQ